MYRTYTLPALLAVVVTAAACDTATFAPEAVDPSYAAFEAGRTTSPLLTFTDPPIPVDGSSSLTRNRSGVTVTLHSSGLEPGHTYTVWAVVFNEPAGCSGACGEDDLFAPAAQVDILYVAGNVAGGRGLSTFSGRLAAGANAGSLFAILGVPAPGLLDAYAAEVHLIVRDHGPAIPGQVPAQTKTFEGGCTADSSFGLGDGPYPCVDVQFAVHLP